MSNLFARTYDDIVAVSKSDSTADPAGPFMGLLVAAAGTLKFTTRNGTTVTISGSLSVGFVLEVPIQRVWSTGTSATVLGYIGAPYGGLSA